MPKINNREFENIFSTTFRAWAYDVYAKAMNAITDKTAVIIHRTGKSWHVYVASDCIGEVESAVLR